MGLNRIEENNGRFYRADAEADGRRYLGDAPRFGAREIVPRRGNPIYGRPDCRDVSHGRNVTFTRRRGSDRRTAGARAQSDRRDPGRRETFEMTALQRGPVGAAFANQFFPRSRSRRTVQAEPQSADKDRSNATLESIRKRCVVGRTFRAGDG
ncbi:protein of unknown function (plasmid) [Pararobbsia alpina]